MAAGIDTANLALLSIASVTNLILAVLIFIYSKKKQSWWFAGAIIAVVGWTIVNYLADNTQNLGWALVWTKMTFSTTAFVAWFLFLFALVFPEYKKSLHWFWPVGLFLPNLLIHLLLFGEGIVQGIEQYEGGVTVTFGPWLHVFTVYFLGSLLSAIGLLIWKLYKNEGENRKRIGYILTGLAIFLFFSTVMNFIIPVVFGYFYTSVFGPYFAVFFTGLTTVAIIRYRLLGVRLLAPQIFTLFIGAILFVEIFIAETSTQLIVRLFIFAWYAALAYLLIRGVQREAQLVDELSEANAHLKELMDIKTEFLQIASHQLRTPLTSLRGLLAMQAEGGFDQLPDQERREMHKNMNSAANNLNNIVNDLLDAMELEGGKLNFTLEQVDVSGLLQESIDTLKPAYDKKELSITFNKPAALPRVEADEGYLRQVFLNIINNAEKYTEKGGLAITPMLKTGRLEITFKDTGIGIDPAEAPKLFGKFVRGKKSALIHTDGSGLGLFIIKKIVEEHHGSVTLESEGLGKGTTVRVMLPLKQTKNNNHVRA
jgi:signal transduction histidine kinase